MTAIAAVLGVLVAGALVAGLVVWFLRGELRRLRADGGAELADRNAEVDRRLEGIAGMIDRRFSELDAKVDRRLSELDTKVDRRLESASRTTSEIHERLGKVGEATAQMLDRAKDLARLEQALRPPKARGGFGELLLGNLLRDRLPSGAYELQYTFRSGDRVDAVIRVEKLVPVDAKFPLENFERMVEAEEEQSRALHEKAFARDVKVHVDAIAEKYVRPVEGTYDFAFMYIPAEAVYYELVCGRTGTLYAYALEKRVFPVSPTTFQAYLQVIALGLRGLQIEQHAQEIMAYCVQLQKDFGRFKEDFALLGKHLGHAHTKFSEAERRLDRFEDKLERASEHVPAADAPALEGPVELPRALDAA